MAEAEACYLTLVLAHEETKRRLNVSCFYHLVAEAEAARVSASRELERVRQEHRFWLQRLHVDDEDRVRFWAHRVANAARVRSCGVVATLRRALETGSTVQEAVSMAGECIPGLQPDVLFTERCEL